MDRKLLRMPAVAQILDTTLPRAYELARQGELPGVVRLGRQVRVDADKLNAFIEQGGTANQTSSHETSAE